jgi:hypothetical protein
MAARIHATLSRAEPILLTRESQAEIITVKKVNNDQLELFLKKGFERTGWQVEVNLCDSGRARKIWERQT